MKLILASFCAVAFAGKKVRDESSDPSDASSGGDGTRYGTASCRARSAWAAEEAAAGNDYFSMCPDPYRFYFADGTFNFDRNKFNQFMAATGNSNTRAYHTFWGYPTSGACFCFNGCDQIIYPGYGLVNWCCNDWADTAAEFCGDPTPEPDVQDVPCNWATTINSKFGEIGVKAKSTPSATEYGGVVGYTHSMPGVGGGCAEFCGNTAGCQAFTNYGNADCVLVLSYPLHVAARADMTTSMRLSSHCTDYPFTKTFTVKSEFYCKFLTGFGAAVLIAEIKQRNGISGGGSGGNGVLIDEWSFDWTGATESKSSKVFLEKKNPYGVNAQGAGWTWIQFDIITYIRIKSGAGKRQADDFFNVADDIVQNIMDNLQLPDDTTVDETTETESIVIETEDGQEVESCSAGGECECTGNASRDEETGECTVTECPLEATDAQIDVVLQSVGDLYDANNTDVVRRRRALKLVKAMKNIHTRPRRRCAKDGNSWVVPKSVAGPGCQFDSFVDMNSANDGLEDVCGAMDFFLRWIHDQCHQKWTIHRLERLRRRCENLY